ncbi:MAG: hypothetical protein U0231_14555 [Nitrospiraceae bacterium]
MAVLADEGLRDDLADAGRTPHASLPGTMPRSEPVHRPGLPFYFWIDRCHFQNILVIKLRHTGDVPLSTSSFTRCLSPPPGLTILLNRGTEAVPANNPDLDHAFVQKGRQA